MANHDAGHKIYRIIAISLLIGLVSAMFAVSAVLASVVEPELSTGSIIILVALAITTLASSLLVNTIPQMVALVWRWPQESGISLVAAVGRLRKLLRPGRLIGIAVVATLVVATGVMLRSPADDHGLEEGPLTIMTAFDDSPNDPRTMLLRQWNQLHPGNVASFEYAPGEPDEQHERMVQDAKLGNQRKADIYVLDIVWLEQFIQRGYIRPLDLDSLPNTNLSDFESKVLAPGTRDGTVWALPLNSDVGLVYHRSDIPGVGRPQKWEDYFGSAAGTAVQAAQKAGVAVDAANAAQLAGQEMLTIIALEAIWAAGGEMVTDQGQVIRTTNGQEVRFDTFDKKGIENLVKAATDPNVVLGAKEKEWLSTEREATDAFANGRTLYMRNWPVEYEQVSRIDRRLDFDVTAPPTPSVLGGQYLAISADTDKPRAAHALIEFFTSASSQLILSDVGGFVPGHKFALDNTRRPYREALREAINEARLRPVTPCYTEFSQTFREGIAFALDEGRLRDDFPSRLAQALDSCRE